ncbi:MAG: hypothetical protein ACQGTM_15560 [bacterium]
MKPILFNTEMVRAILDGRKTNTRRVVKRKGYDDRIHDPINDFAQNFCGDLWEFGQSWENRIAPQHAIGVRSPFQSGDILYVRETFVKADDGYHYRADATPDSERLRKDYGYKYHPSLHMPREAARIFLRVTDLRAERLQNITEGGAKAEGAKEKRDFIRIWNNTVPDKDNQQLVWSANPWVWVIEFERTARPNED